MVDYIRTYVIPAAFSLLPAPMASREAAAMLLTIGLQESHFDARKQLRGPARSFWMFETEGARDVIQHPHTAGPIIEAAAALKYPFLRTMTADEVIGAMQHNDVLACCFARCLLWTGAGAMPHRDQSSVGWTQYVNLWRPGRPRPSVWPVFFAEAWARIDGATPLNA